MTWTPIASTRKRTNVHGSTEPCRRIPSPFGKPLAGAGSLPNSRPGHFPSGQRGGRFQRHRACPFRAGHRRGLSLHLRGMEQLFCDLMEGDPIGEWLLDHFTRRSISNVIEFCELGVDVNAVLRTYKDRCAFWGMLGTQTTLPHGSPQDGRWRGPFPTTFRNTLRVVNA